jgi:hypothetical protein
MTQSTQRNTPGLARKMLGLAVVFLLNGPLADMSLAKTAYCQVESGGKPAFKGKCRFTPDGSTGSFSLQSRNRQGALFGSILVVSVSIVGRGIAEVRGLTKDGINSRWGEARRSTKQPACWVGEDFKVCAW